MVSWESVSDLRILVNSLEIIFCSCEFLSLYPTTYLRLSPMVMSSGSDLPISFTGDWRALGRTIHAFGLPMHRSGSSRWNGAAAVPHGKKHNPFLQSLWKSLVIDVPTAFLQCLYVFMQYLPLAMVTALESPST